MTTAETPTLADQYAAAIRRSLAEEADSCESAAAQAKANALERLDRARIDRTSERWIATDVAEYAENARLAEILRSLATVRDGGTVEEHTSFLREYYGQEMYRMLHSAAHGEKVTVEARVILTLREADSTAWDELMTADREADEDYAYYRGFFDQAAEKVSVLRGKLDRAHSDASKAKHAAALVEAEEAREHFREKLNLLDRGRDRRLGKHVTRITAARARE